MAEFTRHCCMVQLYDTVLLYCILLYCTVYSTVDSSFGIQFHHHWKMAISWFLSCLSIVIIPMCVYTVLYTDCTVLHCTLHVNNLLRFCVFNTWPCILYSTLNTKARVPGQRKVLQNAHTHCTNPSPRTGLTLSMNTVLQGGYISILYILYWLAVATVLKEVVQCSMIQSCAMASLNPLEMVWPFSILWKWCVLLIFHNAMT